MSRPTSSSLLLTGDALPSPPYIVFLPPWADAAPLSPENRKTSGWLLRARSTISGAIVRNWKTVPICGANDGRAGGH
jgi:hypothetical protein